MTSTRIAAALIVATVLGGCVPDIEEPEIDIVGISGGRIGLNGGELDLLVRVDNPNEFAISASRVDYDLDLRRGEDWFDLTNGALEEGLSVPAFGSVTVEIPVTFRLGDALQVGRELLRGGSPLFRVSGRVDLQEPVRRRLPFRQEVTADLSGIEERR